MVTLRTLIISNHVFELLQESLSGNIETDSGDEEWNITKTTETVGNVSSNTAVRLTYCSTIR